MIKFLRYGTKLRIPEVHSEMQTESSTGAVALTAPRLARIQADAVDGFVLLIGKKARQ